MLVQAKRRCAARKVCRLSFTSSSRRLIHAWGNALADDINTSDQPPATRSRQDHALPPSRPCGWRAAVQPLIATVF
ncbi:hypothetical protein [Deefgea salmonis]|uniref:Uncharacterized protein n=1 Tax=Deefgea salmonis TaxID=2875502 RepID=A0ABS8BL99_9NEIS|nr:hypothetical protein [Deefgea salmonis]MCB5196489.1 hypothetical protein [Deefgea salmonis]